MRATFFACLGMLLSFVAPTRCSGMITFVRTWYWGSVNSFAYNVHQTPDGGYAVSTSAEFSPGTSSLALVKTDSLGDTLWTQTVGDTGDDRCYSVQKTVDRGYIVAGSTGSTGAGGFDAWLIKTDSVGRVAVSEPEAPPTRATGGTRFARGILNLRGRQSAKLLDASGRPAMFLRTGKNDVRPLPSGVYFVLVGDDGRHTDKVVIQR